MTEGGKQVERGARYRVEFKTDKHDWFRVDEFVTREQAWGAVYSRKPLDDLIGVRVVAISTPEAAALSEDRYFMVSADELQEEPERVRASRLLEEIHDLMCSCRNWERCDTLGIHGTLLEASSALFVKDEWSIDFEDGWIRVQRGSAPPSGEQGGAQQ